MIKQEELDYIRQIKEENIKLKEAVRYKDREIEQKNGETEAVRMRFLLTLAYTVCDKTSKLGKFTVN